MCGLTGQFSFNNYNINQEADLTLLDHLMYFRGPDDEGTWTDGEHCMFGFRRLAILDLSPTGHQPMVTPDGRYAFMMNGEVYNYRSLREELAGKGWRFRSSSDAEVVLYSLVEWGRQALERFNGMFALAFYDRLEKRLLLARDHVGSKPLYYLLDNEGLVFGSQYDQIMAHPHAKGLEVDQSALALYLRFGYIPAPYAVLKRTHLLEAGSWLEVNSSGKHTSGRYFDFPQYQEPDLFGTDANEAVDAALVSAVRRQMVSDVPLGCFLSGGIDSPLISTIAQSLSSQQLKAFTIGVPDSAMDESQEAARYAQEIGLQHQLKMISFGQVDELVQQVSLACSEPFGDYSIFPTLLVSQFASKQVKVMLSGDGGDELFWGYTGRMRKAIKYAQRFKSPLIIRKLHWLLTRNEGEWALSYFKTAGEWVRSPHEHNYESHLKTLMPDLASFPPDYKQYEFAGGDPDRTAQWVRWNEFTGHMGNGLLKVDRGSMYHSLEVRTPLLDREVIATALRIDWRSCLDVEKDIGKLPLRVALAKRLAYQSRGKRGFTVPMGDWLRGPLREMFENLVIERGELLGLPFQKQSMRSFFKDHLDQRFNRDWGLWIFLSLALWEQTHYHKWMRKE